MKTGKPVGIPVWIGSRNKAENQIIDQLGGVKKHLYPSTWYHVRRQVRDPTDAQIWGRVGRLIVQQGTEFDENR